jgi:serine/threonine protein kinase
LDDEESPEATLPRPGETVAGKYAIVRVIGQGGMGVVYEATHLRLRRRVALKMLFPHNTSPDTVARFEREARAAGRLQHRNVAAVLDVDTTPDGLPYIVIEYLEGHDLEAELQTRGQLPIDDAVGYVLQACDAMAEAHAAGIVHRDLKPSNLFLTADKQGWVVKVVDFGISKTADDGDTRLTTTQVSVGTPLYMSPEQVRSARNLDERTDIWSLGIILYELLTGHAPFEGSATAVAAAIVADPTPPIGEFRQGVPEDLQAAIYRALAKDPAARFATVMEFAQALIPFGPPISLPAASEPLSSMARTPSLAAKPLTPRPSLPARPSHPSYPRATQGSVTLAAAASLRASSSDVAVPVVEAPRTAPRRLIAMGSLVALSAAAALMALHAGRRGPRSDAAPPIAPQAPLAAMAADPVAVPVTHAPPAPESPPAALDSQDAHAAAPVTSPAHPASKSAPASPAARGRPAVASPPPGAATAAPTAAPATPSPRGQSNPLFL